MTPAMLRWSEQNDARIDEELQRLREENAELRRGDTRWAELGKLSLEAATLRGKGAAA